MPRCRRNFAQFAWFRENFKWIADTWKSVSGLPEKLMAAQRAGITKVFIPYDNQDDLEDVADEVKEKLEIIPVKKVTDVLKKALG